MRESSVLDAIFEAEEEDETLYGDEDVEMADAEPQTVGGSEDTPAVAGESRGGDRNERSVKKKNKKRRKKRKGGGDAPSIADTNRFVTDTCRRFRESKQYLVWNAIGCLGLSAFSDIVKEVDAIQDCGGQRTADGKRLRTGGGILWNILKTRDPNAYKEIMAKGREFEKQICQPKKRQMTNRNEAAPPQIVPDEFRGGRGLDGSDHMPEVQEPPDSNKERKPVRDRIRVPVSYEDLFEEGEIHE